MTKHKFKQCLHSENEASIECIRLVKHTNATNAFRKHSQSSNTNRHKKNTQGKSEKFNNEIEVESELNE